MSRKTRLYDPGTLYHVILRGNWGQRIFLDDSDSRTLLSVFDWKSAKIREVANALNRDDATISRGVHKLKERLKESTILQERLKKFNLKKFS